MAVQLDWQQDLEDESWPRRHDYGPPNKGPRVGRYVLIAVVVLLAAGAAVLWAMNQRGLKAVKADVQEAVTYIHWTLQQDDPELFINTLDGISPRWVAQGRTEWQRLSDAAQDVPAPAVESVSMDGNIAETTVRWTDATTGSSYLARRWFRLVGTQWLWTAPPEQDPNDLQTEELRHVTLAFHPDDREIMPSLLPQLDEMVANRCQQFGVSEERCHVYLQWDVTDAEGQPLVWRDMPLPPLAATTGDEMDAPVYLLNGRQADWQSAELRRRLQQFYPGKSFVVQSTVSMLRPVGARDLPASLLGDPFHPLLLPTPALEGVAAGGQPHPRWLTHVDRLLADLVLRKAERYTLGSADYVDATWALHQALLAMATGLPTPSQLAPDGAAASDSSLPVEMPDLTGLGAALHYEPDDLAVQQLANLVQYLQNHWSSEELAGLPQLMGTAANLNLLLNEGLGIDRQGFNTAWRQEELAQPDSPLAALVDTLQELSRKEAAAAQIGRPMAMELYSSKGRTWRAQHPQPNELFGSLHYDENYRAAVDDIGSIGPYVWAKLTESDGELAARDLRFYVKDATEGWRRNNPEQSFWGNERSITSDLVNWTYYALDEAAVQTVAPQLEDAYQKVTADFGLPTVPISVVVEADTMGTWDFDRWQADIDLPSPQSFIMLSPDDDEVDALRRDVIARMVIKLWQQKDAVINAATDLPDKSGAQNILVSAVLAELETLDIPTEQLLKGTDQVVTRILEQRRLPEISELVASPQTPNDDVRSQSQILLAMYIFQRHGFAWLDSAVNDGLAATLDRIMQEQGWTLADLEADWRAYLAERSNQ